MIRVLHVVTHMNRGGLETMIMNYYRHIDRERIQFDFLTHRDYDGDFAEEIHSLGGIIYHLSVLNPLSHHYKSSLSSFFDNHPEYLIIHVHQDCMSSVILKEAKKHGISVRIAHSHNSNQDKNIRFLLKLFYMRLIPRYATKLFACSEEAGKWMFCGAPFEVLNNAIDARAYAFNNQKREDMQQLFEIRNNELVIGHVGRFNAVKNQSFLLDVFRFVAEKIPAKLLLVGDGEQKAEVEEKVKQLGLQDRVIFTGVRSDVADLMQAMDVFIFPSLYEGLPLSLIEAQAAGLPCLISDKVPIECIKTSLVERMSLHQTADSWAKKAISLKALCRRNTYEEIKKSGYDIVENVKRLENYYLEHCV